MATDRFFIGPYDSNSGLQTDYKPWAIPEDAFAEMKNAYVFRGRVRKRFGSRFLIEDDVDGFLSRLRIKIATTDGAGNINSFTPRDAALNVIATPAIGQQFSIGTQVFTVVALGNPATMLISGTATLATFDTTTGNVIIQGAAALTDVYYYPALPVMGLLTFERSTINDEQLIAFDTRFAYNYSNGWDRISAEAIPNAAFWGGSDSEFFWATTWSGNNASDRIFFVTNFNETEPLNMRYYDSASWNTFKPQVNATDFLNSARILVPFKNRLLAFNTWEGPASPGNNYTNRLRYSQVGSPLDANAWRSDIAGRGGGIDAPTMESIVTVEFVKDRLIVFCERSTWEIVYTGNQVTPFAWQQINTELGAESTFSVVPFDKVCIGVGNVGIHACNGANVERIDSKIPNTVFEIHNESGGVFRVYGIRDYYVEMIYWTFPDIEDNDQFPYPNRVLVFNYKTGTWAIFDDTITCFGYYQPVSDLTWDSTIITFSDEMTWDGAATQAKFRNVIAGNQQGFTFICDADVTTNALALQITNISVTSNVVQLTVINHNLLEGDYIYIDGVTGDNTMSDLNGLIYQVDNVIDKDTFEIDVPEDLAIDIAGTYTGGGLIRRVSQISIKTKQFNFYAKQGRNAYIPKVDFLVDATDAGQLQVDFFVSSSNEPLLEDAAATGTLLGTGTLDTFPYTAIPFEAAQERLWHPVYFQADGEYVQLQLTNNDDQMRNIDVQASDFELHAIVIYAQPTSYRLQ